MLNKYVRYLLGIIAFLAIFYQFILPFTPYWLDLSILVVIVLMVIGTAMAKRHAVPKDKDRNGDKGRSE